MNAEEKKELWKIYPHTYARRASGKKWVCYPFLKHISERITPALVNGGGRFIVTIPPRHGKSEFISRWVPTWFLDQFPDRKVILASYAADFASKWGAAVKENCSLPEVSIQLSSDTKAKSKFQTKQGGQMMTAGVGGPMTGEGGHLIIIDDPLKNWEDAMSEIIRNKQKDWFRSVARTRLEPGGTIIVLMTRWHEDDLAGWLLGGGDDELNESLGSKWELINFPAIAEGDDILGRREGEALCPERYNEEDFAQIRPDVGPKAWASLFQQRPYIEDGDVIKRAWLRHYKKYPAVIEEKIIVADLTFKKSQTSDFAVFEAWGRTGPDIFLLDQIRGRMDFPAQADAFLEMIRRHPDAMGKYIEEAANGAAIISIMKEKVLGIVAVKPKTAKEARLHAVAPLYESGNVHYPDPSIAPWVETNLHELLGFPNVKHDDTVDTASMALKQLGGTSSLVSRLEALNRW